MNFQDNQTVLFVSLFINLKEDRQKNGDKYIELFQKLASSKIPILLFISQNYYDSYGSEIKDRYPNVLLEVLNLEDLWVYQAIQDIPDIKLPLTDNSKKDTRNYHILMNSKLEVIYLAKLKYPNFQSYFFLDCGIFHIFRNYEAIYRKLEEINNINRIESKGDIILPATHWAKLEYLQIQMDRYWNQIYWRFLGGVIMVNNPMIDIFWNLFKVFFTEECVNKKRIVWEVNIWALMEAKYPNLAFNTYLGDHNDSMLLNMQI